MRRQQVLQVGIAAVLVILFLVGCGGNAPTAVSEAPAATSTPEQVAATLTPEPPTATPTPEPPTVTPTPEPPTDTPVPPTATSNPTTARIEGKVFRSDTDGPIANVVVKLNDTTETTTDEQGHYSFDEVKPGQYAMSVEATFKGADDSPCPVAGILQFTQDNWLAFTGTQESTGLYVIVASSGEDTFSVAAGDTLQKDIDLDCK